MYYKTVLQCTVRLYCGMGTVNYGIGGGIYILYIGKDTV